MDIADTLVEADDKAFNLRIRTNLRSSSEKLRNNLNMDEVLVYDVHHHVEGLLQ